MLFYLTRLEVGVDSNLAWFETLLGFNVWKFWQGWWGLMVFFEFLLRGSVGYGEVCVMTDAYAGSVWQHSGLFICLVYVFVRSWQACYVRFVAYVGLSFVYFFSILNSPFCPVLNCVISSISFLSPHFSILNCYAELSWPLCILFSSISSELSWPAMLSFGFV